MNPNFLTFSQMLNVSKLQAVSSATDNYVERVTRCSIPLKMPSEALADPQTRKIAKMLTDNRKPFELAISLLKLSESGIKPYTPTEEDIHSKHWMPSTVASRCIRVASENEYMSENEHIQLDFAIIEAQEHCAKSLPFWMLYDQEMIGVHSNNVFIAHSRESNQQNQKIIDALSVAINDRSKESRQYWIDRDHGLPPHPQSVYIELHASHALQSIKSNIVLAISHYNGPINIFIDEGGKTGGVIQLVKEFIMDYTKDLPEINWVVFDFEQAVKDSM